jgi:hypothetical protein
VNFGPGRTRANNAIVTLGPLHGDIYIFLTGVSTATAHVIVDVTGYFQ